MRGLRALAQLALMPVLLATATAQVGPERGLRQVDPRWHALEHARVVVRPGEVLEDTTVVLREGVIVAVGVGLTPPEGARVHDCSGLTVYAGLVEPHLSVEAPRAPSETVTDHWHHELVTPQRSALDGAGVDPATAKSLRALGFTAAAIAPKGGIFRGTVSVVALGEGGDGLDAADDHVIASDIAEVVAFERGGFRSGGGLSYPGSEMGAIALVRQTLFDADHYARSAAVYAAAPARHVPPAPSAAFDALARERHLPLLFDARNELQVLRAARIAREFERPMIVLGSGQEYRRLEAVRGTGLPVIVPLDFPEAPDVSTLVKAEGQSLRDLMAWEQAPTNPRRLVEAGVTVALTTARLDDVGEFPARLRRAQEHGLAADKALAMLTTDAAALLGLGERLGQVAPGFLANLVVTDGELFGAETKVRDVWIMGRRHVIERAPRADRTGTWDVFFEAVGEAAGERPEVSGQLVLEEGDKLKLVLPGAQSPAGAAPPSGESASPPQDSEPGREAERAEGPRGADKDRGGFVARKVTLGRHDLHFHLDGEAFGLVGVLSFSGIFQGEVLHGLLVEPDGAVRRWRATRASAAPGAKEIPGATAPGAVASGTGVRAEDPLAKTSQPFQPILPIRPILPGESGESGESVAPRPAQTAEDPAQEPATEPAAAKSAADAAAAVPESFGLPFGAYGLTEVPAQVDVRVEGATLWTSGPQGIVADGVLVVTAGRVVYAGPADGAPATPDHRVLDARGKHVTPGLIDCHSHTGISGGVNEGGQRVTCEVRIGDVIDPDAIEFYHQLAGGLTAANQLHGSANAIGGQNSVIKLRWGARHPDGLRLAGAPGGVKFALGENPKRVASGSDDPSEYPRTRFGVEALIRDRLNAGLHYAAEWAQYDGLSDWERRTAMPPRRDLELEALAEIASGTRWIHCHSYRQDEILMLARMAQEYGFQIGTFQHVLEGYKVAEVIREVARGASSFADWWAYKFEVIDAIPDSPAIMHEVGVNVSINSDSDEFARRLNTEAAKGVKYGGMSPHDALSMVTINPAIQLGVEARVGSLEAGKDADFALWSGDPLSYYSRCEATYIDGREYFSLARDAELRAEATRERQRILQRLLSEGARGKKGERAEKGDRPSDDAARFRRGELTMQEAYALGLQSEIEALWRSGIDPRRSQPGVCGCWDLYLGAEFMQGELDAAMGR